MKSRRAVNRTFLRLVGSTLAAFLVLGLTTIPAQAAAPVITGFSPNSGPAGTTVTINGSNFSGATAVAFNGTNAGFSVNAPGTQITAPVPGGATTGPISVTTPEGTAVSATSFVVVAKPVISSFAPASGSFGTPVTIFGSSFAGTTAVKFNGKNAPGFSVGGSGTTITVAVPNGATSGRIAVTTPVGTGKSASDFVVTVAGGPVITSFSPTAGPVGTLVTIVGGNFTGVSKVKFGGTVASFVFVSDSQVNATVPGGAKTGRIALTTAVATATSPSPFTVMTLAVPKITNFSPKHGKIGTKVTIDGNGFFGTTAVRFGGTPATAFTVVNDHKITTNVPAGTSTGPISVTNPLGTATSAAAFTVNGPKITSFSPTSGPIGTHVTINGSGFTGVTAVAFNGAAAAAFTFVSDTKITAKVPHGATTGPITVSVGSGTTASTTSFTVVRPHPRKVTLSLSRGPLFASGRVTVADGYVACRRLVPVVIQRLQNGQWRWMRTLKTKTSGTYRGSLPNRPGVYRAKVGKMKLGNGAICGFDLSNPHHA